jgi:hypothetical protein
MRDLRREREGEGAGSGSEIDGDRARVWNLHECLDSPFRNQFGFGSRDKYTGSDVEHEVAKRCLTGDVLQRLAGFPSRDKFIEPCNDVAVKTCTHERFGRDFPARPPRDEPDKELSVG